MIILPEMMKKVGYKTAAIGTWHSKVEQIPGETARQMGFEARDELVLEVQGEIRKVYANRNDRS